MQTLIQTPTPALQHSLDFYTKLGYTVLSPALPTLVTDGKVIIEINPERTARAGIKLYHPSWDDVLPAIEKLTRPVPFAGGVVISDPSAVWIYLMDGEATHTLPADTAPATLGNCMGLSIETTDVEKSSALWQALGFRKTPDYPIEHLTNADGLGVAFMGPLNCPHLFFNPALTYFNGKDNLGVIQRVREAGIPIAEEITLFNPQGLVDNIVLRDPGGLGFFVFSD